MSKWISVEDRLPRNMCYCVICYVFSAAKRKKHVCPSFYNEGNKRFTFLSAIGEQDVRKGAKVTHWMPLPEPPNE